MRVLHLTEARYSYGQAFGQLLYVSSASQKDTISLTLAPAGCTAE